MDEIKINLKTKFMRGVISKILSKVILKQFGVKVEIRLDEININNFNGDVFAKINMVAKMDEKELHKIVKNI